MTVVCQVWRWCGAHSTGVGIGGGAAKARAYAKLDLPVNYMDTSSAAREVEEVGRKAGKSSVSAFAVAAYQIAPYIAAVFTGVKKSAFRSSAVICVTSDWSNEQQQTLRILMKFFSNARLSFIIVRCCAHVISLCVYQSCFVMHQALSLATSLPNLKEWQKGLYNCSQLVKHQHQNVIENINKVDIAVVIVEPEAQKRGRFAEWCEVVLAVWTGQSERSAQERELYQSVNFLSGSGGVEVVLTPSELWYGVVFFHIFVIRVRHSQSQNCF